LCNSCAHFFLRGTTKKTVSGGADRIEHLSFKLSG
jgi:hypothetical protein